MQNEIAQEQAKRAAEEARQQAERAAAKEAQERETYERLRKKFEA